MKTTVKEFLEMNLVAEKYQRTVTTGSHNKRFAEALLQNCADKANAYIGPVTLATINDSDALALIDGNSRYNDFKKWYANELQIKFIAEEVNEKGETKTVVKTTTYKDAPQVIKDNIDNAWIEVTVLENLSLGERQEYFKKLNSGKALTNAQKAAVIMPDSFYKCAEMLGEYMESHEMLTDAQRLNDVPMHSMAQIIANLNGTYTASNKKLMESIEGIDIDSEKFAHVLEILNETEFGKSDKYELITLATILFADDATVATIAEVVGIESGFKTCDIRISDFTNEYKPNCVHCSFDSAGANSVNKNVERFTKMLRKIKNYMSDKIASESAEERATSISLADIAATQAAQA